MLDFKDFFVRLGINLLMLFFMLIFSFPFIKTIQGWLFLLGISISIAILITLLEPLSDKYRKHIDKKTEGQKFSILRILSALAPVVIIAAIMLLVIFYAANYFNIDINSIK